MDISNESLYQYLIYSSPIYYTEDLVLYPVKMGNVLDFNLYKSSIIVRKNSIFPVKKIIKMPYLDFLFYCHNNVELAKEFNMPFLPYYYSFALRLLQLILKIFYRTKTKILKISALSLERLNLRRTKLFVRKPLSQMMT